MQLTDDQIIALSKGLDQAELEHDGMPCTTNKPFRTDAGCAVFVSSGETVIKVSFGSYDDYEVDKNLYVNTREESPVSPLTPLYWIRRAAQLTFTDSMLEFTDKVHLDAQTKTITSVRDGVQTYMGIELGMTPHDKPFTVYRSPETVAQVSPSMLGLPITNQHIPLDREPMTNELLGDINSSEVVEAVDTEYDTTLAIKNKAHVGGEAMSLAEQGQQYFSLGYKAQLVPHDKYDFEQVHMVARHLALVESPRGGATLTFNDGKGGTMEFPQSFLDADGEMNIQRVAEIVQALPEAIKMMPIAQLAKMMPLLEKAMATVKANVPAGEGSLEGDLEGGAAEQNLDAGAGEEGAAAEENLDEKGAVVVKKEDGEKEKPGFTDAAVATMITNGIKTHATIVEAARGLLAEDYNFTDKDGTTIMRDALKRHSTQDFADSELSVAFKMLKVQPSKSKDFGDANKEADAVWEKDL